MTTLKDGDRVLGRLRVVRILGMGGFGEVYEVQHELTRHHRALKVLKPELVQSSPDLIARFFDEASAAGRIGSPHIVETFDAGHLPDGTPFLLMELLRGESLRSRLARDRRLSLGEACAIARQACSGLTAAHEAGIVHRDIKPDNLFLTETEGRLFVKLLDFGISKFPLELANPEAEEGFLGTPAYMAPEQIRRTDDVDARADVYSLGVTLFEALAGRLPFTGRSANEVLSQVLQGQTLRLEACAPELGQEIAELVHRAIAPDRAHRITTALALRDALPVFEVATALPMPEATPAETRDTVVRAPRRMLSRPPQPAGVFVGRRNELEVLATRLSTNRLVTVVGIGGSGKTRLVLEALRETETPICFVAAGDHQDLGSFLAAVAKALDIPIAGASDEAGVVAQLGHALLSWPTVLLVVDTFEHLAHRGGRETIDAWLAGAAGVRVLITSQVRLGFEFEAIIELPRFTEGLELLELCARRSAHQFTVTDQNRASLRAIVDALDALPLAIELAAPRLAVLTANELLERLNDRFAVLQPSGLGAPRGLRTVLEWSWQLLTPFEQRVLTCLATMSGGCRPAALEGMLASEPGVLEALQSLRSRSLVHAAPNDRLEILNSVRDFALAQQVETRAEVARRHARYFVQFGLELASISDGRGASGALAVLNDERGNLSAALRHALHSQDTEGAQLAAGALQALEPILLFRSSPRAQLALVDAVLNRCIGQLEPGALLPLWLMRAAASTNLGAPEGLSDLEAALEREPPPPALRVKAAYMRGSFLSLLHRVPEARLELERALTLSTEAKDLWHEGRVRSRLGSIANHLGEPETARTLFSEALVIHRAAGDRRFEGITLSNLGVAYAAVNDHLAAGRAYREALEVHRSIGNKSSEAIVRANLGELLLDEGGLEEARGLLEEALATHQEVGNRRHESAVRTSLAAISLQLGLANEAELELNEAIRAAQELGDTQRVAFAQAFRVMALSASGRGSVARDALRSIAVEPLGLTASTMVFFAELAVDAAEGDLNRARARFVSTLETQAPMQSIAQRSAEARRGSRCLQAVFRSLEARR